MKKMTIRVDDYVYDKIKLISKENKISSNKVISRMLKDTIDYKSNIDYKKDLDDKFDLLNKRFDIFERRQLAHFKVSKQYFANHAYLSNADINEDKCLKELFKNKFYD
jgi:hypothetical protein